MYLFGKNKKYLQYVIVFFLACASQAIVALIRGDRGFLGHDSQRYIQLANCLLDEGIGAFLQTADTPFYLLYPIFLAGIFVIFGENYWVAVVFQILFYGITCLTIFAILQEFKESWLINGMLTLYFALFYEVAHWNFILYSDAVALFWVALTVYIYLQWEKAESEKKQKTLVLLLIILLVTLLSRTNAFIFVGTFVCLLLIKLPKKMKIGLAIVGTIGVAILLVAMKTGLVYDYTPVAEHYIVDVIFERYRTGLYISNNPTVYYHIPEEHMNSIWMVVDMIILLVQRMVIFWSVWQPGFSVSHILFSVLQMVPMYIVALYSVYVIVKKKKKEYYFLIALILSYNFVQAAMWMDVEFRYRIPVFILVTLLCQVGVLDIWDKLKGIRGKRNEVNHSNTML